MAKAPEEIARKIIIDAALLCGTVEETCNAIEKAIPAAIREAVEAAVEEAEKNACGLWCPKCGAHLKVPGNN